MGSRPHVRCTVGLANDSTRRITMTGGAVPRFETATIDRPDPAALARFYGELLEWPVPEGDGDYVVLDPPGGGTALPTLPAAARILVAPTWPDPAVQQQLHLDLAVDDADAAHSAGHRPWCPPPRQSGEVPGSTVYPVGHPFCLCTW